MANSKVVLVRGRGVMNQEGAIDQNKLLGMFNRGFELLMDKQNPRDSLRLLFSPNDRVGIKINTISGKMLSTRPDVALSLAKLLLEAGIRERNIIIWDLSLIHI